jgi:WD40 repeat protein
VRLWDIAGGKAHVVLDGLTGCVRAVAFSRDGKKLACGHGKFVRLWDVERLGDKEGRTGLVLEGHTEDVNAVAFAPRAGLLASGGTEPAIRLWDVSTGKPRGFLKSHTKSVTSLAFSPDGKTLLSGSRDHTAGLWDMVPTPGPRKTLPPRINLGPVNGVVFSPDGQRFATASTYASLNVWESTSGKLLATLSTGQRPCQAIDWSADGEKLVCAIDETVRVWDVKSGNELHPLRKPVGQPRALAFSPDGRSLLIGRRPHVVQVWDVATRDLRTLASGPLNFVVAVAGFSDGRIVAVDQDGLVRWWERDGQPGSGGFHFPRGGGDVRQAGFDRDGQLVAITHHGNAGRVALWQQGTKTARDLLANTVKSSNAVALSPDGKFLAAGHEKEIRRWDTTTGKPLPSLTAINVVSSLLFSPDGRTLAAGSNEVIHLWDVATDQERRVKFPGTGHASSLALSPGGSLLVVAGERGRLAWWDIRDPGVPSGKPDQPWRETGRLLGRWTPPGAFQPHILALAPDGRHLAVGNSNETVYILRLMSR